MFRLEELVGSCEHITEYTVLEQYCSRQCIIQDGCDDILGAIEYTLHELKNNGATDDDIYYYLGAHKMTVEEADEMDNDPLAPITYIDLDYIIYGHITV